jgi:hypothetical protein
LIPQSIQQDQTAHQADPNQSWEEECYRWGWALARQEALRRLHALAQRLHDQRPMTWKDKGWREWTFVTRFGDLRIRRHLYLEEHGVYHCLLEEGLDWPPAQMATPSLTEQVVILASRMPFRKVGRTVTALTAVLSPATLHRRASRGAHRAVEAEHAVWERCFERGAVPPAGDRVVPIRYLEADGVWGPLQQEETGLPGGLPALTGPHASRPWVQVLRNMLHDHFPLN